jgi:hypothetical protein
LYRWLVARLSWGRLRSSFFAPPAALRRRFAIWLCSGFFSIMGTINIGGTAGSQTDISFSLRPPATLRRRSAIWLCTAFPVGVLRSHNGFAFCRAITLERKRPAFFSAGHCRQSVDLALAEGHYGSAATVMIGQVSKKSFVERFLSGGHCGRRQHSPHGVPIESCVPDCFSACVRGKTVHRQIANRNWSVAGGRKTESPKPSVGAQTVPSAAVTG